MRDHESRINSHDTANGNNGTTMLNSDDDDLSDDFEWDPRQCFFSNTMHKSMADNLEHMYRNYGFSIPDMEYLIDAHGLMKYLGAKLCIGHIPFYVSGLNENAKRFVDKFAVQRHMIDTGRCKILYDDNEVEYEDYYDYSSLNTSEGMEVDEDGSYHLALSEREVDVSTNGMELVVASKDADGNRRHRILGTREFHRYYRQRHRPLDTRVSVCAVSNDMLTRCVDIYIYIERERERERD